MSRNVVNDGHSRAYRSPRRQALAISINPCALIASDSSLDCSVEK